MPKTPYKAPGIFEVEADASSASYFLALGALVGPLKINGIGADSVQGDAAFVEYLVKMGATVTRGENWIKTGPSRYGSQAARTAGRCPSDSGCGDDFCGHGTDV